MASSIRRSTETRTARVRVELPNPELLLLHDMYVDADIDTGSRDPVLAVPESAVMDTGSRQAVFVDRGEGRFEPRQVKLGYRGNGYVEVRQGIVDSELVVVSADFLIDTESNLKAALKGFAEGARDDRPPHRVVRARSPAGVLSARALLPRPASTR